MHVLHRYEHYKMPMGLRSCDLSHLTTCYLLLLLHRLISWVLISWNFLKMILNTSVPIKSHQSPDKHDGIDVQCAKQSRSLSLPDQLLSLTIRNCEAGSNQICLRMSL